MQHGMQLPVAPGWSSHMEELRMKRMKPVRLSALVFTFASAFAAAQTAQTAAANPLAAARVFSYEEMAAKTAPNGAVGRFVVQGTLATGESISVHETMQPAGTRPNPAHRIEHSELIVVEEGTLAFMHDGKTERADAGSVIYVALGTLHAVKNVGAGPAKYVVIQIGGDTNK
jgi:mannose-6-phosphate isomerase-like protein (cupin superfamily)